MISVVMPYFNRLQQLRTTLISLARSKYTNFEVCIFDDGSDFDQRAMLAMHIAPQLTYRIENIKRDQRKWSDPCVPFNRAAALATGDVLLLQSPECVHGGDVLTYTAQRAATLRARAYLSFGCYNLNRSASAAVLRGGSPGQLPQVAAAGEENGWYNHARLRPVGYHFCAAIDRAFFQDTLGGFDERYADGISFDDDAFLLRLQAAHTLIRIIDDPGVFHLWHPKVNYQLPDTGTRHARNRALYQEDLKRFRAGTLPVDWRKDVTIVSADQKTE